MTRALGTVPQFSVHLTGPTASRDPIGQWHWEKGGAGARLETHLVEAKHNRNTLGSYPQHDVYLHRSCSSSDPTRQWPPSQFSLSSQSWLSSPLQITLPGFSPGGLASGSRSRVPFTCLSRYQTMGSQHWAARAHWLSRCAIVMTTVMFCPAALKPTCSQWVWAGVPSLPSWLASLSS